MTTFNLTTGQTSNVEDKTKNPILAGKMSISTDDGNLYYDNGTTRIKVGANVIYTGSVTTGANGSTTVQKVRLAASDSQQTPVYETLSNVTVTFKDLVGNTVTASASYPSNFALFGDERAQGMGLANVDVNGTVYSDTGYPESKVLSGSVTTNSDGSTSIEIIVEPILQVDPATGQISQELNPEKGYAILSNINLTDKTCDVTAYDESGGKLTATGVTISSNFYAENNTIYLPLQGNTDGNSFLIYSTTFATTDLLPEITIADCSAVYDEASSPQWEIISRYRSGYVDDSVVGSVRYTTTSITTQPKPWSGTWSYEAWTIDNNQNKWTRTA